MGGLTNKGFKKEAETRQLLKTFEKLHYKIGKVVLRGTTFNDDF